jgi:hypothetical protein
MRLMTKSSVADSSRNDANYLENFKDANSVSDDDGNTL